MTSEEIFTLFNDIDPDIRMLCVDSAAVGCYLYQQGHEAAGVKLLHTAINAAGLDTVLVKTLLEDPQNSFKGLAMHAEIRALVSKI